MARRSHFLFLWGGEGEGEGEGVGVVRYRGVIKEKSPDFRSPEVGTSEVLTCINSVDSSPFIHMERNSFLMERHGTTGYRIFCHRNDTSRSRHCLRTLRVETRLKKENFSYQHRK